MMEKRRREDAQPHDPAGLKNVRIDKSTIRELTLKRLMSAGHADSKIKSAPLILCEGCHRRAPPAESACPAALVGECRFCSRRTLCVECWSLCAKCGMETCPLCSVQDYSGRDTVAVCLDCKRHSIQRPIVRR